MEIVKIEGKNQRILFNKLLNKHQSQYHIKTTINLYNG